jgi:hypothetical protein
MSDWMKANELWVLKTKASKVKMWMWKDKGNIYDMSGTKIVPLTLKGYVELAEIVRKRFMKTLVDLPRDYVGDEALIWAILDEIRDGE